MRLATDDFSRGIADAAFEYSSAAEVSAGGRNARGKVLGSTQTKEDVTACGTRSQVRLTGSEIVVKLGARV
jgi:hypothetical protein